MKKLVLVLAFLAIATSAIAVDLTALTGKVGLTYNQEGTVSITNFNITAAYPVALGQVSFKIFGLGNIWNGGGLQGLNGSIGASTTLDGIGTIYVQHNEGREFFRGDLNSSNEIGIYHTF